jgi:DNA-directed RNA polymerase specialized sigma24 family protein
LRHHGRFRWEPLDDLDTPTRDATWVVSFEDQLAENDALARALAQLDPQDVACLTLIVIHGFTAAEAARITSASAQAVAKRIGRAKRRLLAVYLAQDPTAGKGSNTHE